MTWLFVQCALLGSVFINLFFAGQYNVDVFAGVSLANMFANISHVSLIVGMSGAVETLGSQLNGAENYRMVGVVLQRSILILATMSVPILAMWYYATRCDLNSVYYTKLHFALSIYTYTSCLS